MASQDAAKKQKLQVLKDLNNTLQLHAERLKLANRSERYNQQKLKPSNETSASLSHVLTAFSDVDIHTRVESSRLVMTCYFSSLFNF